MGGGRLRDDGLKEPCLRPPRSIFNRCWSCEGIQKCVIVIHDRQSGFQLLWFCIARLCDWLKKTSRHFINQSEVKPKPIVTCLHAFSRAWHRLHVLATSSDCFIGLSASVVIGQSDYFGGLNSTTFN